MKESNYGKCSLKLHTGLFATRIENAFIASTLHFGLGTRGIT